MAKKDLSHAKGLDALFSNSQTLTRNEPGLPKPVKKKTPESKPVQKKVVKPEPEVELKDERVAEEQIPEVESEKVEKPVEKQQIRSRRKSSGEKVFSVNLEGVRKRKIEYTGIRLKKDLFERLETIAQREKLKSTNSLIALVLEAYCEGYES